MTLSRAKCCVLGLLLWWALARQVMSQGPSDSSQNAELPTSDASALLPDSSQRAQVEEALRNKDYKKAETILIDEATRDPRSPREAKLLALLGGIYFLDGAYVESVEAWRKSDVIFPLDERSRFTLTMAYVKLHRVPAARKELEKLSTAQPRSALYVYWSARLDYDSQHYTDAISQLQRATELDPKMARAYNLLGLCYDYQGQLDRAISAFSRAVELNRRESKPSPWPNVDMANSQIELDLLAAAEMNLREAIAYDADLPKAHYDLGRVLEKEGRYEEAVEALKRAAALDGSYAEPHYLLGRIYQRLGEPQFAKSEIQRFQQLQKANQTIPSE